MFPKKILQNVRKPGRYLGSEQNAQNKKLVKGMCNMCLAFPDLYEIGMSHVGIQILYSIINARKDARCERVFTPARDCEKILEENNIPLASLESNTPLYKFDIIGFSLQYELCFTNILTMLALSKISFRSTMRKEGPLLIAGGPAAVNPEPIADFFDIFVIGDGEHVIGKIIESYNLSKTKKDSKEVLLERLAMLEGVYVPRFYDVMYAKHTSKIISISPINKYTKRQIKKVSVAKIEDIPYPTKPIVPYIKTVHNRAVVEIMRGCPNVCKFCQARSYYNPVRTRSIETISNYAERIIDDTGHEDLSLLSLSSGNYPMIEDLFDALGKLLEKKKVSFSLPSLRVEKLIEILPQYLSKVKKTGITFAPEAGSQRLREYIGKNINIDYLVKATQEAYKEGYRHIKLYFMIGLPTETQEDLDEMISLIYLLAKERLRFQKKCAQVNVSIGTFIPKPHTFFDRMGMARIEEIENKKQYLADKLKKRYIKYNFTPVSVSLLEASLTRGSRLLSHVIESAWRNGARLDAWNEEFDIAPWNKAFADNGFAIEEVAQNTFDDADILPWQHIKL